MKAYDHLRFSFMCGLQRTKESRHRVAVVGAGPAGLFATGYLVCMGHEVHVYDKLPEPGGLMLFVIPEFRVSISRVKGGTSELVKVFNVKFYTRTKVFGGVRSREEGDAYVTKEVELNELVKDYDAVLIATGTWSVGKLNVPGENLRGVYSALEYLFRAKAARLGHIPRDEVPQLRGRRVAIIGGDIMAVDAALEAFYDGADAIYIFYEGTLKDVPAGEYCIRSLIDRGVKFVELTKPRSIVGDRGEVTGIELAKVDLHTKEPIPGSEFLVDVNIVINATKVKPTPPVANGYLGIKVSEDNKIVVNERHVAAEKVFAAGDVVLGPTRVGDAALDGLYAAESIHEYLMYG
ncbi:MAG: FAD-dependent oxidoreductase [Desulfurococcales archaeon]|nr:FAD-dependent oxidoreductase [Desulfurococcales archaeon]